MTAKKTEPKKATQLLKADHHTVDELFTQYEAARSPAKKKELVDQICTELTVHAQVEEEIFYPAAKRALKDHELVPEALVEHETLKSLIAQIEGQAPEGEIFNARVKVLAEYVKHHVEEEETELFPKTEATSLDLEELGERITLRKEQLLAERKAAPG